MQTAHLRQIIHLGLPIAIGQVGVIVMGFADTIMVGWYTTDALAAQSFTNNLFTLFLMLLSGYSLGITPLAAAQYGKQNYTGIVAVLRSGLLASTRYLAALTIPILILYLALPHLGQPPSLLPLIRPYYLLMLASLPFVMLFNTIRQAGDATSDTTSPTWAIIIGNAVNIVGNALLIYGHCGLPELGLLGAGIATLLGRIVTVLVMLAFIAKRTHYQPLRIAYLTPKTSHLILHTSHFTPHTIHRQALPISLQIGMETATFSISAIIAGSLGETSLAAYQILITTGTLGFLFFYSFANGMAIHVSQIAGNLTPNTSHFTPNPIHQCVRTGWALNLTLSVIAALTFLTLGGWIIQIFTPDTRVQAIAAHTIWLLALYQIFDATQITYAAALRATANIHTIAQSALLSYIIVGLPLAYILSHPLHLGVSGIYIALNVSLLLAATLYIIAYRRKKSPKT